MNAATLHATNLDDAPALWFLNTLHIILAKSESTGGAYSLFHLTATPGFATPYHLHHAEDEAFYVLDGEFTFFSEDKKIVLGPGGYIFLPPRRGPRIPEQQPEGRSHPNTSNARRRRWICRDDARDGCAGFGPCFT